MDKTLYYINLYDYYGELLTSKQKFYFEAYYFNNLSLSEISEEEGITRNAIYRQLKVAEDKLKYYEDKLELLKKSKEIKKLIENIDENTKKQIRDRYRSSR